MTKVYKICISPKSDQGMEDVYSVSTIAGKGIVGDRYFNEDNDKNHQITLIESENIVFYNKISDQKISYIDFRRNIVTRGIELNPLIGKELQIGSTKIKVHKLCEPCLELQNKLQQTNFVKNLTHRGGLRCEILTSGLITVNDDIVIIN
jgi:MOSC domain-containing protein YiiM